MTDLTFSDIHCHPTLKTYGSSFTSNGRDRKSIHKDPWHQEKATPLRLWISKKLGIVRYSQSDFKSLLDGNVTHAFVSYYPFEKGFFENQYMPDRLAAFIGNQVTRIGYGRVRNIQEHKDYFHDLEAEELFWRKTPGLKLTNAQFFECRDSTSLHPARSSTSPVRFFPSIEGGHVLNTGMEKYGRPTDHQEVLENIRKIKQWEAPPYFITLAHNFQNDLCGHARSLERLGPFVDQSAQMDDGFTKLGWEVVKELLSGLPIYIDVKHMSVMSRKCYYDLITRSYQNSIPIVVSHGAVTGCSYFHLVSHMHPFAADDINFYDEELIRIAETEGLFGLQLDAARLTSKAILKVNRSLSGQKAMQHSATIVWNQIRYIAEVLDRHGRFAWDTVCLGSDFDGTISPLNGIWTAASLPGLGRELIRLADQYLQQKNPLTQRNNKSITSEEIIARFASLNVEAFINKRKQQLYEFEAGHQQKG